MLPHKPRRSFILLQLPDGGLLGDPLGGAPYRGYLLIAAPALKEWMVADPRRSRGILAPWFQRLALGGITVVVALVIAVGPAVAQGTWSGSGTYTMNSTPSTPPCSGQGTGSVSLTGDAGGTVTGTITFTLGSESGGCSGTLAGGGTAYFTGTLFGNQLSGTDQYGGTWSGTLNGGSLTMSYTSAAPPRGCVQWCTQTATFSFAGSGTLGAGSFGSPASIAGATAGVLGVGAVGAGLASLRVHRQFRSKEGWSYKYDNGVFTRFDNPAPSGYTGVTAPPTQYAPTPPAGVPPPPAPILGPGSVSGPTINEGPMGGAYTAPPSTPPPPDPPAAPHQGGPTCPIHHSTCIPATEHLSSGPTLRWFCPPGGHYPWG
jgi:hypothetical protein